ncbi:hypothetical protein ACLKA7_011528 [Drosophila subpalustris]
MLITNHPSDVGRGGAAIIIRSNLIHHPLSFKSQANAQAVAISLGEALALLEEKRRLRRRWLRNGNFEDNRAWKLLSRRLRSVLTEDKRRHFETLLEGMDPRKPSDFNVWNLTKGIKRQAPSNFAIQTDQGWSKSDSEKASIFGHFTFGFRTCGRSGSLFFFTGRGLLRDQAHKAQEIAWY